MFSFFRKIRKDQDGTASSASKEKKSKEKTPIPSLTRENSVQYSQLPATNGPLDREPAKNKPAQKVESGNDVDDVKRRVDVTSLRESGESVSEIFAREEPVPAKTEKTVAVNQKRPNCANDGTADTTERRGMEVSQRGATAGASTQVLSYASVLKAPEKQSHNVKPCGHGTVAISPRLPSSVGKKNEGKTPPESPEVERKVYFRRASKEEGESSDSDVGKGEKRFKGTSARDGGNDTVTGVMKVRFELPKAPMTDGSNKVERADAAGVLVNSKEGHEDQMKNLINQEAKFQSQLNELSKQLTLRDAEVSKLRFQIEELQRDVFAKSAGMDRLQAELQSANKESEMAKQRLRHLEDDLQSSKQKYVELNEQLSEKTDSFSSFQSTANEKIAELQHTIRELNNKIDSIEHQIQALEKEKEQLEKQKAELTEKMEEQRKNFDDALAKAVREKAEVEHQWSTEFEKLRTVNLIKEQELLDDFEWKLREIEQTCKKKLQDKDKKIEEQMREAYKEAEIKLQEAEKMMKEVANLKSYETEVKSLRGLTEEQKNSLSAMLDKQEELKMAEERLEEETKRLRKIVDMEKENLQHMQRVHNQEILEKERKLQTKLEEAKTEIAAYWESRLLQECSRLKNELEQIYLEEKHAAIEGVRAQKDQELEEAKKLWDKKLNEKVKEIQNLHRSLEEKDSEYRSEMERIQTKQDTDIMELRRVMDKIDMTHHERFEKMVQDHEEEIEKINADHENKVKEIETNWQMQVSSMRTTLELVKEQMENEAQQKIQNLIDQHRADLDSQWENLVHQKDEAIRLIEEEYVTKYKQLEEQFYTQQKSHSSREVELLKTIDALKNEIASKESTIDDLQNNVETLEGGVQVLNQEVANQSEKFNKHKSDLENRVQGLQEYIVKLQMQQRREKEEHRNQVAHIQKQNQATIDQLQRKCQCLTKLFEEVRARYERRESRQEDLNIISDLRQVIAEQEKDLACLNEEKRYYQMKLMNLEKFLTQPTPSLSCEEQEEQASSSSEDTSRRSNILIPPTIPECDDED